jgi:hypothetical protein
VRIEVISPFLKVAVYYPRPSPGIWKSTINGLLQMTRRRSNIREEFNTLDERPHDSARLLSESIQTQAEGGQSEVPRLDDADSGHPTQWCGFRRGRERLCARSKDRQQIAYQAAFVLKDA